MKEPILYYKRGEGWSYNHAHVYPDAKGRKWRIESRLPEEGESYTWTWCPKTDPTRTDKDSWLLEGELDFEAAGEFLRTLRDPPGNLDTADANRVAALKAQAANTGYFERRICVVFTEVK